MVSPRTKWIFGFLIIVCLFAFVDVTGLLGFFTPEYLTSLLRELGFAGPFALIGLMTVAVVVSPIPSLPLDLAAGAAYGVFWGTVYVVIGAELGAIISFLIARVLGRDLVGRWLKRDISFCQQCTDHHLVGLMVLARLVPVFSFDIVSYGAGLTNMSLKAFALATLVGMIPPTVAFTYFGRSVVSLEWTSLLAGSLLVLAFLVLPQWIIKHRKSRWVRVLQGKPIALPAPHEKKESEVRCGWCGKSND